MKTLIVIALTALITGCATEPKQCWNNPNGNQDFYKDTGSCQMYGGDSGGAYITGGIYAAAAANRQFGFCMQSKGYHLQTCSQ